MKFLVIIPNVIFVTKHFFIRKILEHTEKTIFDNSAEAKNNSMIPMDDLNSDLLDENEKKFL